MKKSFYVTTPIYYVNDVPHIGHTCTTVVADIIARYHRQKKENVFFLTGTDEHGAKVAQAAKKKELAPQKFCDQISQRFQSTWKALNISNDFFIRTTDKRHKKIAANILKKIYKNGDIYKDKYKGLYCIGCEKFLTKTDLENGHCPLHPLDETVEQEEENWFFKLSKYTPQIIKLIENDKTNYIFPEGKRREVLAKLKAGVHDISFSRANVAWGIPVPWDKSQTVYVWVEALLNYYTAAQFLEGKSKFWPADLHILGKEILWFHTVIWQAMLLSADLPLPKKTFIHSFYTIDGQKMSKSLGNVISPDQLIEKFDIDGARYLVASSFPDNNDADVGWGKFQEKYNADLANNLGNLISRTAKMAEKFSLASPKTKPEFYPQLESHLEEVNPAGALDFIWQKKIDNCNLLINKEQPWQQPPSKAKQTLTKIIKEIQNIAYNIKPFIPQTAERIEEIFSPNKPVKPPQKPLFLRIV